MCFERARLQAAPPGTDNGAGFSPPRDSQGGQTDERQFKKIANLNLHPDPSRNGDAARRSEVARDPYSRGPDRVVRRQARTSQWPELTRGATIEVCRLLP